MRVKTLLRRKRRDVITVTPATAISEAMELLIRNNIGCLPVIDGTEKLVGIISDKDIFKKIHETNGAYQELTVGDLMSEELVVGIPDDEIAYVASLMDKNWIRHVPIVDGDKLVGLVSQRDIMKTRAYNHEIENRYLNLYLEGLGGRDMSGHV